MKTEPIPSDREVLAGLVERVTYQNAENGFCVLRVKARGHRELVTLVGHAAVISAGESVTFFSNSFRASLLRDIPQSAPMDYSLGRLGQ